MISSACDARSRSALSANVASRHYSLTAVVALLYSCNASLVGRGQRGGVSIAALCLVGCSRQLSLLQGRLQVKGQVTYNGYRFDECMVGRTAAYVDQNDNHIAELTVRETLVRITLTPRQNCKVISARQQQSLLWHTMNI